MLKKTINYTDFNGEEKTEDFYFHFGNNEVLKLKAEGYLDKFSELDSEITDKTLSKFVNLLEELIERSFGVKTEDGGFDKEDFAAFKRFKRSEAYDKFFIELATNEQSVMAFLKGVFPADMVKGLEEKVAQAIKGTNNVNNKH